MTAQYPNLSGLVPHEVERAIYRLYDHVNQLNRPSPVRPLEARVKQVEQRLTPERIRRNLQLGGTTPLNVTGLLGLLAQPQTSGAPTVDALPSIDDPLSQDGSLVVFNNVLYRFDGDPEPGSWASVLSTSVLQDTHAARPAAAGYASGTIFFETDRDAFFVHDGTNWIWRWGIMRGTLSPNQKPGDLGVNDTGFLFNATDFDRVYRWSGAAWADAPGQPVRGQIALFDTVTPPGTGWQVCDGSSATRSTATGGTTSVTVPDYQTGDPAYLKLTDAGHTVGPTAASGTVATPSATTTVDNNLDGSTVAVGSDTHNHGPGTLELRRTELICYLRL